MAGEFGAGSVVSKMILDRTQWKKSTKDAEKEAKGLSGAIQKHGAGIRKVGMAMTAVGGAIVGSLALMVKKYVEAGDQVHKMAQRTGFATETLSELKYAAEISGANIESLEKGVKKMSKTIVDAGDGLTTYVRAFSRIGIKLKELEGLNPEQQFLKIGNAIASVEDPTIRTAAAVDIFGRAGTQLLPLFNQGVAGMEALRAKARELGIVFDQEAANKAARLADAQVTLRASMAGVSRSIAETFVPMLSKMAEGLAKTISKVTDWMKKNPKLASTIVKITAGVGALMLVLGPLLIVLPGIVTAVGLMSAGFLAVLGPIAAVTAAVGILAVTFLKVKSAQDEARKADERYQQNIVKLKTKLNDARKAIGMTGTEWGKLTTKYKGNYAALAMAIHKGKEGVELQKALAAESKKSKEAYDKQKKATLELGKSFETTYEKQKTWVDYIKTIGLSTIKEKQDRIIELNGYLKKLEQALKDKKITLETYTAAVKAAKDEIRGFSEELTTTAIPKTRDMGGVLQGTMPWLASMADSTDVAKQHLREFADQMGMTSAEVQIGGYNMMSTFLNMSGISMPKISLAAQETKQKVTTAWTEMADGIKTSWIQNVSDVLKGSKSLGDGLKGIFGSVKNQFFDMVSQMIAKWSFSFITKILSGGEGLLSGVKGIFSGIGGFFSKLFGKGGEAQAAMTGSGGLVNNFLGGIGKMAGPIGIGLLAAKLIGFKNIQKTVQDVWKAVSENIVNSIKAIGKISDAVLGAVADVVTGIGKGIGSAIAGVGKLVGGIGGLFGGGGDKNTIRILRDIKWWTEKSYMLQENHILAELVKIKDERLGEMFPKFDSMLNEFYQIRDATKGTLDFLPRIDERIGVSSSILEHGFSMTVSQLQSIGQGIHGILKALTAKGTVYVDVFRSEVFENVGAGIARSVDDMGGQVGGAIKGIRFPEMDSDRIAEKLIGKMPEARRGGSFVSPGPVMTHGRIASPEIAGTARQISEGGIPGGGTTIINKTVNIDGTIITDREYTRERLIPEILDAMDVNVRKTEMQEKLGIK